MTRIDIAALANELIEDEMVSWTCAICGAARLCPYAAPDARDLRQACPSCGDLLAGCATTVQPPVADRSLAAYL